MTDQRREPTTGETAIQTLVAAFWFLVPLSPFIAGAVFFERRSWEGLGSVFSWAWTALVSVWSPFDDVVFNVLVDIVLVVAAVIAAVILVVYWLLSLLAWGLFRAAAFAVYMLDQLAGVSTGGAVVAGVVGLALVVVFVGGPLVLLVSLGREMAQDKIKKAPSATAALAAQGKIVDAAVDAVREGTRE